MYLPPGPDVTPWPAATPRRGGGGPALATLAPRGKVAPPRGGGRKETPRSGPVARPSSLDGSGGLPGRRRESAPSGARGRSGRRPSGRPLRLGRARPGGLRKKDGREVGVADTGGASPRDRAVHEITS